MAAGLVAAVLTGCDNLQLTATLTKMSTAQWSNHGDNASIHQRPLHIQFQRTAILQCSCKVFYHRLERTAAECSVYTYWRRLTRKLGVQLANRHH